MESCQTPDACPECGAQLMSAMVRCRQCGWRRGAPPPRPDPAAAKANHDEGGFELQPPTERPLRASWTSDPKILKVARDVERMSQARPPIPQRSVPGPSPRVPAQSASSGSQRNATDPVTAPPPKREKSPKYVITVICPACSYPVQARGRLRGKRVKCPECRGPVLVEPKQETVRSPPAAGVPDVRVTATPVATAPAGAPPPPNWVAEKAMLQRRLQAMQDAEQQMIAHRRPRWTWRDLIPDFIYGLASDRTLAIVTAGLVLCGAIAGGIWWGPFSDGGTVTAGVVANSNAARGFVSSLSFSADGQTVAVGRTHGRIELWDAATHELRESLTSVHGKHVALDAGAARLIAGDERRSGLYDVQAGTPFSEDLGIESVFTNPAASHAVSLATDDRVLVWNLATGKVDTCLKLDNEDIRVVAIGPDGRECVCGTQSGKLFILDSAAAAVARELIIHQAGPVTTLAVDASGERVAAVTADNRLHVVQGESYDPQWPRAVASDSQFISRVLWLGADRILLAGGTRLAICSPDAPPLTWDADLQSIDAVAVSPDGRLIAVGCRDEPGVIIYDAATKQPRATLDIDGG